MGGLIVNATRALIISVALYITYTEIPRLISKKKKKIEIVDEHHKDDYVDQLDRVPSDVLVNHILSELDLVSHCRLFAATNKFASLIPRISSVTITLQDNDDWPKVVFLHLLNYLHGKLQGFEKLKNHIEGIFFNTWRKPKTKLRNFLERFSGLESVTIQLPLPILASDYLTNPKSWFTWDSHIDLGWYYFIMVQAFKVDDDDDDDDHDQIIVPTYDSKVLEACKRLELGHRHFKFHYDNAWSMFGPLNDQEEEESEAAAAAAHPKLKSIVSRDVLGFNNGKMTMRLKPCFNRGYYESRYKLYYLSSKVLSFKNNTKIKDACLLFVYSGEVGNGTIQDEDLIMQCLNYNQGERDYSRDRLREVIPKIVSHADALEIPLVYDD